MSGKLLVLLAMSAMQLVVLSPVTQAQERGVIIERIPFDTEVQIQCEDGQLGEPVAVEGNLVLFSHRREDETGDIHAFDHYTLNLQGVGLRSGERYIYTGAGMSIVTVTSEDPNNFRVYTGSGTNAFVRLGDDGTHTGEILLHDTIHVTQNADGELTADVNLRVFSCNSAW